ncbi:MAG: carboxypeptidase-like regulatory domain-containing protein, partial [Bacteroidetes bacterium]|nr:carboxypeptidase-like regulatory domain-containing protein [Candidatus Cryptobacteroides excrementavium]
MVQMKTGWTGIVQSGLVFTLISLFFISAAVDAAAAGQEKIRGKVVDIITGEPLIGAGVIIQNTTQGTVTDLDGIYELDLPDGEHYLTVSYIGYRPAAVLVAVGKNGARASLAGDPETDGSFVLTANGLITVSLAPDEKVLENAVVTARKNLESLQALQNERISSGFAIENMGAREMSIKGISNAQESVAKLSGISIANAGQLIVRGLGDRYSTTTLNGLPIASPNPDNKLIPLDIFPASTIQNITVSKVYEASSFADYSGAHVDISTKEGQGEDFFNISFSTGGYFHTLANDFYRMDGKSLFLSPKLDPTANNIAYSDFNAYSKSKDIFGTSFRTFRKNPLPDLDGGIGFGKNFKVGGQTLSLVASASIKTGDETMTDAFYRTYEASSEGSMQSDYNYDSYTRKIDIAALVDMDYTLRESDNIGLTVFFARNAKDTHLDRRGMDYQESYDLVGSNQVTHFYTLQNYQLSGHHEVEDWLIDWGASYTMTSSDEPDRRQVMYRRGADDQWYFFKLNQQETQRYFGRLDENELVADIRATYRFNEDDRIRFGLTAKDKIRTFRSTRFYYDVKGINNSISDFHNPDAYINFENIQSGLISVNRSKYDRDQYDASNLIGAAFVETDLKFGEKWFLNAGLRMEASRQSVDYNDDVEDLTR